MAYDPTLIMDVGMHLGDDTEFYLKKGFRVVGVEANPRFVEVLEKRFAVEIEQGRLIIVPHAVDAREGTADFYINEDHDDWSSLLYDPGARRSTPLTRIKVKCVTFESILEEFGIPYYLKTDIEGSDLNCLKALHRFTDRPKYVSIEAHDLSYLSHLLILGYSRFKLVNQALHHLVSLSHPPKEGLYVDMKFHHLTSGPFGEESPGEWLSLEQVAFAYLNCRWWFSDVLKPPLSSGGRRKNPGETSRGRGTALDVRLMRKIYALKGKARYQVQGLLIRSTLGHFAPQISRGWYDFHALLDEPEHGKRDETERLRG
jgi:FkbM family methyltransferase